MPSEQKLAVQFEYEVIRSVLRPRDLLQYDLALERQVLGRQPRFKGQVREHVDARCPDSYRELWP